ncbi:hypothetical protein C8J56DRAFT_884106 [Mycena floridula]|nr:hypothetical protein C8J56DRAFT_884106 [Mycena floridula]
MPTRASSQTVEQRVEKLMQRIAEARLKKSRTRKPETEAREAEKVIAAEAALDAEREICRAADQLEEFNMAVKAFETDAEAKKAPVKKSAAKTKASKKTKGEDAPPSSPLSAIPGDEEDDVLEKEKADVALRLAAEQEEAKKLEARLAAAEQARFAAEEQVKVVALEKERLGNQEKARIAAEEQVKVVALERERLANEEKARITAEEQAKLVALEKERLANQERARFAAEEQAKLVTLEKEKLASEERARIAAEEQAKLVALERERRAKRRKESPINYDSGSGGPKFIEVSDDDERLADVDGKIGAGDVKGKNKRPMDNHGNNEAQKRLKKELQDMNLVTDKDKTDLAKELAEREAERQTAAGAGAKRGARAGRVRGEGRASSKGAKASSKVPKRRSKKAKQHVDGDGDVSMDDEEYQPLDDEDEPEGDNGDSKGSGEGARAMDAVAAKFEALSDELKEEKSDLLDAAISEWASESNTPIPADLRSLFVHVSSFGRKWSRHSIKLSVHLMSSSKNRSSCPFHRYMACGGRNGVKVKATYSDYEAHGWPVKDERKMSGPLRPPVDGKIHCGCSEREAVTALILFKETEVVYETVDIDSRERLESVESMRGMILDPRQRLFFVQVFYDALGVKNWEDIFACPQNSKTLKSLEVRSAVLDQQIAVLKEKKKVMARDYKDMAERQEEVKVNAEKSKQKLLLLHAKARERRMNGDADDSDDED